MARWKYNMNMPVSIKVVGLTALGTRTWNFSGKQSEGNNSEGLLLVAQSLSLSLTLALLGPPPPGERAICSPLDLILACLWRPHQGANCKDGSGFQHLSTRNWTHTPNSFHVATRQTSDGSNFWSLLSGSGTWCPTTPVTASLFSRYLLECGI